MGKIIRKAGGFVMIGIGLLLAFLFSNFLEGAIELGAIAYLIEYVAFAIAAGLLYFILSHYLPSHKEILWYAIVIILFVADLIVFWPYRGIFR